MSDSPWSKPDEPDDVGDVGDATIGERSLGPPSSSLPNVPDITPAAGTPLPDADADADAPAPPPAPEGTAVMPVVSADPTTVQPTTPPARPSAEQPLADDPVSTEPRYVVADRVPWYRTIDDRARAGIAIGLVALVAVIGIVWAATRGSDDGATLVTDGSTTVPGQFGTDLDTSTTDLAILPLDSTTTLPETTLPETTTTTVAATTTIAPTTTTTTLPATTTTTLPATTTTTLPATTTTTTLPPPPEVVVPGSTSTTAQIIQASPGLGELDRLMSSVGFYAELNALTVPYTLLAPSNEALAGLDLPSDPEAVRDILRRHLTTDGRLGSLEILVRTELTMLDGSTLSVDAANDTVGGAAIIVADKGGADTDQILHVIDAVVTG